MQGVGLPRLRLIKAGAARRSGGGYMKIMEASKLSIFGDTASSGEVNGKYVITSEPVQAPVKKQRRLECPGCV